jgi:hypothetical protein
MKTAVRPAAQWAYSSVRKGEQIAKSVMAKLEKRGKGIILMHDFRYSAAEGLPELIRELNAGGYKVVHMVPREPLATLPKYDEMAVGNDPLPVTQSMGSQIATMIRQIEYRDGKFVPGTPVNDLREG